MKKFLSLLLTFLLIVIPLMSCETNADSKDGESDNNTGDTTAVGDTTADTMSAEETSSEALEIPNVSYEDEDFVVLCHTNLSYSSGMVDFDEPSDDLREQAFYERSLALYDLLGVNITQVQDDIGSDVYELFKTDVSSGLDTYDLVFNNLLYSCKAVSAGYCDNIDDYEYIDLSKSWWNEDCTEQLSIGGNHYMVSGDIALSDKDCMWVMYFLKDVLEESGIDEDLYELVYNGEWTFDKMYTLAKAAVRDVNGSGDLDDGDIYGFVTHIENYVAGWLSAGLKLATLDDNGIPYASWGTNEFVEVYENIQEFMTNSDVVSPDSADFALQAMMQKETLFCAEVIGHTQNYRSSDYDFGILPYPKYSEDVDQYYSYVVLWSCVMTIPVTTGDTDMTGIVAEAMAYYGQEIITPAYYEVQLQSRFSRDPLDAEMLDIIFTHRAYDLGVYFDWGGAYSSLLSSSAAPATLYASLQKSISKAIEKSLGTLNIEY
ncbi:MAG: hypothetical protein LUG88_04130 [Clostridia bacterium]|nr:hypothetical protein [Clostridia bacterium]